MYVTGRWAIFWIVVTNAVANSARNENENTNGVVKSARIVFPSAAEEKRFRQRWDNLTNTSKLKSNSSSSSSIASAAAAATRGVASAKNDDDNDPAVVTEAKKSKNIIEDIVRQTQHPIKKQIKFKRLRYLSSIDPNNGTKVALQPPPPPPQLATLNDKHSEKDDTKDLKPLKFTESDTFRIHQLHNDSGVESSAYSAATVPSKDTSSIDAAVSKSVVIAPADPPASSTQRTTAAHGGAPPHRKKRRRLPTSTSIVVPMAMSPYEQQQLQQQQQQLLQHLHHHHQQSHQHHQHHHHNVPRDQQIDQFLDFGKKISATSSSFGRTHANAIDGVKPLAGRFSAASVVAPVAISKSADADDRADNKGDRQLVAGTSLQQNHHKPIATTKSTAGSGGGGALNASLCAAPNFRSSVGLLRQGAGSKTLKREIGLNGTVCGGGNATTATESSGGGVGSSEEREGGGGSSVSRSQNVKNELLPSKSNVVATTFTSELPSSIAIPTTTPPLTTTSNPSTHQLTTKILSTAVITSVSIKSNERFTRHKGTSITAAPIPTISSIVATARSFGAFEWSPAAYRKQDTTPGSRSLEMRNAGISSGGDSSTTSKSADSAAVAPQARYANLSKQYATISRNVVPPYFRTVASSTPSASSQNVTLVTTSDTTTAAAANPNIQYLVYSTGSRTSTADGESVADTTTLAWNWKALVGGTGSSSGGSDGGSGDGSGNSNANVTTTSTPNDSDAIMRQSQSASSSTPLFVTYEGLDRDTENLIYHVRNETVFDHNNNNNNNNKNNDNDKININISLDDNSTSHPSSSSTKRTIFTKNVHHNNYTNNKNLLHTSSSNVIAGEQNGGNGGDGDGDDDVGDDSQTGFRIVTYVLAGLGAIPLVIGIALVTKMLLSQNKKQIFEGSEYSSEYNRNTLEFNAGVTSSPIATKLPRVSHQAHWEIEKKPNPSINLPNNSQWEFPRSKLRLQTILGQGNFGQVWKAEADDINGHEGLTRLVAVKMVKEISSTREKEDLIKELIIMQHLGTHPNVVTLLGCCTEKEPYMLIMEYVMYGKLLSFLRDHRTRTHYFNFSDNGDTLTSRDLTVFAYCVARGMEYLQNKQVIHRDLAARNILIDHNKLCKIADFGMSRYVEESGQVYEHRQSKGALPIRWMAPESLQYSCYNHKTDVWSFGILMWEIVTLGSMPYASMGARVVMRKVKEGYRLEKPKYCKTQFFNVISKCWQADPNKRPTFTELKQELYELLEDPEHLGNYVDLESLAEDMSQVVHGSHNEKFII